MPALQDLRDVDKMSFEFHLGSPFRPFEQLMGVLPAASKELVPLAYQVSLSSRSYSLLRFTKDTPRI
jgi:5'-3' exoribonuclease 1